MKLLFLISLLSFSIGVNAQRKDTSWYDGCNWHHCVGGMCNVTLLNCEVLELPESDSLQAERFFLDSVGNQYIVSYLYTEDTLIKDNGHHHYVANCLIVKWKGNKSQTILSNYKAIYSPVECAADNTKLWLKRLYDYLNKQK